MDDDQQFDWTFEKVWKMQWKMHGNSESVYYQIHHPSYSLEIVNMLKHLSKKLMIWIIWNLYNFR